MLIPMVLIVQKTIVIPHFIDTVADFPVVRVMQILRCRCGEDIRAPTVADRVVFVVAQRWFPMVQAVQRTIEVLKLQFIDKVFDFWLQVQQVRVKSVRRQSSSHSCSPLNMDTVVAIPVVCNDSCRVVQSAENCEAFAVAVL